MNDPHSPSEDDDRSSIPPGPILPAGDDDAYRTVVLDLEARHAEADADVEAPFRKTISLRDLPGFEFPADPATDDQQTIVIDPQLLIDAIDQHNDEAVSASSAASPAELRATQDYLPAANDSATRDISAESAIVPAGNDSTDDTAEDEKATRDVSQEIARSLDENATRDASPEDAQDEDFAATRVSLPDDTNEAAGGSAAVDPDATRVPAEPTTAVSSGEQRSVEDLLRVRTRSVAGFPFGTKFDADYQVLSRVGQGAMGVVYAARQTSLNREITFKTLKSWWESLAAPLREQLPEDQYVDAINQLREKGTLSPELTQQLRARMKADEYEKFSGHLRSTARQSARSSQSNQSQRDLFLSEAVVTSNLVHPNIVPIHDMGCMEDGTLFYSMKWVRGKPWDERLQEMDLHENLNVLMSVCDAMAFAHHNGVINRDLKPENVMLGAFGEVLVLDWGLAVATSAFEKKDEITNRARPGAGTPVYMAPELVTGPMRKIGTHSDIYLLGAILFEIVTGLPPHDFTETRGMNAREKTLHIIKVVGQNVIRDPGFESELVDVALRAMETEPADRYASVVDFQAAIRSYLKHEESLRLSSRASQLLNRAQDNKSKRGYSDYQNASALYEEALHEWPDNVDARTGRHRAKLDYARFAHSKGDYDLGLHVLEGEESTDAGRERLRLLKARRLRRGLKTTVVTSLAVILVGGSIAFWSIYSLHGSVENARLKLGKAQQSLNDVVGQRRAAEQRLALAQQNETDAVRRAQLASRGEVAAKAKESAAVAAAAAAQDLADEEKKNADLAKQAALTAQSKVAAIEKQLTTLGDQLKLQTQRTQAARKRAEAARKAEMKAIAQLNTANDSLAKANAAQQQAEFRSGRTRAEGFIQAGQYSRAVPILQELLKSDNEFAKRNRAPLRATLNKARANAEQVDSPIETGAISGNKRTLAWVQNDLQSGRGEVVLQDVTRLQDAGNRRKLSSNEPISAVSVSTTGETVVGAADRNVLLWSGQRTSPVTIVRHSSKITAIRISQNGRYVFTATADDMLTVHSLRTRQQLAATRLDEPIHDMALMADQRTLLLVMGEGKQSICRALTLQRDNNAVKFSRRGQLKLPFESRVPFVGISLSTDEKQLALMSRSDGRVFVIPRSDTIDEFPFAIRSGDNPRAWELKGHSRPVNAVAFSPDGETVLTASDDYTLGVWRQSDGRWQRTEILKGHGGAVESCEFLSGSATRVVSMSRDRYIRIWDLENYRRTRDSIMQLTQDPLLQSTQATDIARESMIQFVSHRSPATNRLTQSQSSTNEKKNAARTSPAQARRTTQIRHHDSGVLSARFSRTGDRVLTASRDRTARVWDLRNSDVQQKAAGTRAVKTPFRTMFAEGHTYNVDALMFMPSGDRLVTAAERSLSIWDALPDQNGLGQQLAQLTAFSGCTEARLLFSPMSSRRL